MDFARKGADALAASKYDEAIRHYTSAIAVNSKAVDYYIKRSTAYQRASMYPEALADAEIAVVLATNRAKRELIKDAQLRRGIALYFNERYADAGYVLGIVERYDAKEKTLSIWNMKVAKKLEALPEGDEKGKVTAKELPDVKMPAEMSSKPTTSAPEKSSDAPTAPKPIVPTPADKIKHDWYQDNEKVVFSLMAKGVPKDKTTVEIDKDSLSISFPIQGASDFGYTLDPFFAEVDPEKSTWAVKSTKVEVTLRKKQPGLKWKTLEGDRDTSCAEQKSAIPSHIASHNTNDTPPSYPTSSRNGPKNWDTMFKEPKKNEDGSNDENGDEITYDEMDEYDGDETSRFFKHLYKGATPEMQRAMMKSYSESGGTVLSTDWSNVGKRQVVPEPPEGMEAKTYND